MLLWTLKISIISFIIIYTIHQIIIFLKETLTEQKVKDYVTIPQEKYKEMYQIINSNKEDTPSFSKDDMKYQLQKHLKSLTDDDIPNTTLISHI